MVGQGVAPALNFTVKSICKFFTKFCYQVTILLVGRFMRRENEKLMEEQRRKDAEALRERQEMQRKAEADAAAARKEQERLKAESDAKIAEERRQREALERKEQERIAEEKRKQDEAKKAEAKAKRAPDKIKLQRWIDEIATVVQSRAKEPLKDEVRIITHNLIADITALLNKARKEAENL